MRMKRAVAYNREPNRIRHDNSFHDDSLLKAAPMIDPTDRSPIPKMPFWIGAGGVVPFVVLSGAVWAAPEAYTAALLFWLSAYAAVVASFLGAVHWGAALLHPSMSDPDRALFMTWSVVPAITGWVAQLMPIKTGLLMLIAIYVIQFAADRQLSSRFHLPDWYLRLRGSLTPVAVLCLALALIHLARH
jgi:hypothetical protein